MILATKAAIATSAGAGAPYLWVMVGNDLDASNASLIYTSTTTDGSSWTQRTSPFGTTDIQAIATDGNNNYVAVGNGGLLATSTGGITWTLQTSSFGTDNIWGIGYGNDGYWVAVGDSGKVATSTDMITWTQRVSGTTSRLTSAKWGNNLWIIGGAAGLLKTASDPTNGTFTTRSSTLANYVYTYYWPTNGIWVAGSDNGTTGALASSTNGTTWSSRTGDAANASYNQRYCSFAASTTHLTFAQGGGGTSITVDSDYSTNGTTWSTMTVPTTRRGLGRHDVDTDGNFVSCSDKEFDLTNGTGYLMYSTSGTAWTLGINNYTITGSFDAVFRDICHSAGVASIR